MFFIVTLASMLFLVYRAFDETRSINLIKESLRCGVNYLETGPWYGQGSSERTIGKVKDGYFLLFDK